MTQLSIISAGQVLRAALLASEDVRAITRRVYPIISDDEGKFPYIVYRRAGVDPTAVTKGRPVDVAVFDVWCYAEGYSQSVALAEAVREALDGKGYTAGDMTVRRFSLIDASEDVATSTGARVQILKITAKI